MKLSKLVKISEPILLICKIRKIKVIARPCNHMRCLRECLAQPKSGTHSFPIEPLPPFFFSGLFVGFFLFGFLSSFFNFSVPESAFPHTKGCAYCSLIEGIYTIHPSLNFVIENTHYDGWISGDKSLAKHNLLKTLFVEHKPATVI